MSELARSPSVPVSNQKPLQPKRSKIVAAIVTAAAASLLPFLVRSFWSASEGEKFVLEVASIPILAVALILIVLCLLPIYFWQRSRTVLSWWLYVGISLAYVAVLQLAIGAFTGGSKEWDFTAFASAVCVGWTFWFMLQVNNRNFRLVFSMGVLLLCLPFLKFWASILMLPVKVWLGTEVIQEIETLRGDNLQIVQIPNASFTGPNYHYELKHRAAHERSFKTVTGWERPPGRSDIETATIDGLLVAVLPGRDVVLINPSSMGWGSFVLREIVRKEGAVLSALLRIPNHDPLVTLREDSINARQFSVNIYYTGLLPQTADLEISESGDRIDVVAASFAQDPRLSYLEHFDFAAEGEDILSLVRDMDGDGVPEILISHTSALNGRAGNIWSIYSRRDGQYQRLSESLSMRKDVVSFWRRDGQSASGVTTYLPKSATEGQIITYTIEGNKLERSAIAVAADDGRLVTVLDTSSQLGVDVGSASQAEQVLCQREKKHRRCMNP